MYGSIEYSVNIQFCGSGYSIVLSWRTCNLKTRHITKHSILNSDCLPSMGILVFYRLLNKRDSLKTWLNFNSFNPSTKKKCEGVWYPYYYYFTAVFSTSLKKKTCLKCRDLKPGESICCTITTGISVLTSAKSLSIINFSIPRCRRLYLSSEQTPRNRWIL